MKILPLDFTMEISKVWRSIQPRHRGRKLSASRPWGIEAKRRWGRVETRNRNPRKEKGYLTGGFTYFFSMGWNHQPVIECYRWMMVNDCYKLSDFIFGMYACKIYDYIGYTWLRIDRHCCVWLCMGIHGGRWLQVVAHGFIYMVILGYRWI